MPDFNVRADSVNVEQIMEQIRGRIREKRGVDYTEEQIQEMASVKLEKFLDPTGVRSDLLEQFRRSKPPYTPPDLPNYAFEEQTLFETHRGPLRLLRKLLNPFLKLLFNPNPLIQALNIQSRLNTIHAEREARNEAARHTFDSLHYEVLHNLVVETTRMSIEVKNLKMKVESLTSRLEFNERRARALESVVVYKPTDEREPPAAEARPPRESHERRDRFERRDQRDQRGPRESSRDQRDAREPREHREPREPREPRDAREARDPREQADPRPATTPEPGAAPTADGTTAPAPPGAEGPGQRSRRRRRRRGRRGGGGTAAAIMGENGAATPAGGTAHEPPFDSHDSDGDAGGDDGADDHGPDDSGSPDQAQ